MPSSETWTSIKRSVSSRFVDDKVAELFANTGFRRLYFGRVVGRVGDKLYSIAAMWLVYELTGSTFYTGLAGFLTRIPQAFSFLLGPLVDRSQLRRLLVASEITQAIIALGVPAAALLGYLNVWVVLGVMPLLTLLRRISAPAEQAVLPRIVEDRLLARANSVDKTTIQSVGAVTELLSGTLIVFFGAAALYIVDAVTFLGSAAFFALMRVPETEATGTTPSWSEYLEDVREGFATVRHSVIGHMIVAVVLSSIFLGMSSAVLPAFADIFGNAEAYALLIGATTIGTLVGSVIASYFETIPFGKLSIIGFLVAMMLRLGAVAIEGFPAALVFWGAAVVPLGVYNVLASTIIQVGIPDEMLGRVSSTIGSLTGIIGPSGVLLGGVLGARLGSRTTIAISAIGLLALALYWGTVPALRQFEPVSDLESDAFELSTDKAQSEESPA